MNKPQQKKEFVESGFFVIRSALLPFDELLAWSEGIKAPIADDVEKAIASDRTLLRERLHSVVSRPEVREALFVASPVLDESLHRWIDSPDSERGLRVERSIVRYFMRMVGRATPFGLFAGCSVGKVGSETHLNIAAPSSYRRYTRLDMDYVHNLIATLNNDPNLRKTLRYKPNSSLYRAGGRLHFVESKLNEKIRFYQMVTVEDTDYLNAILARAEGGATISFLAEALANSDLDVSLQEAEEFIVELIDSQILISDLEVPVTVTSPIDVLISQLREHQQVAHVAENLARVRTSLEDLDKFGMGASKERYLAVAELLEKLPAEVELPRLFQVDMIKPAADASLSRKVVAEIIRGVEVLHALSAKTQDTFKRFREEFIKRYGEGREIPLFEALDEELGIGFNSFSEEETLQWNVRNTILLRKFERAITRGDTEIKLDDHDLDALKVNSPTRMPDAFAALVTVAAASQKALSAGEFQVVMHHVFGPSGARMLGRFCHTDNSLHEYIKKHLQAEAALEPDAVFAEIAHLPEGQLGNILVRPVLRDYEIAYLGRSGAPAEQQIPISDLSVSVIGQRVVLRSARLGREIIPRLTSAHSFTGRSLGIYRFLCSLQNQHVSGVLGWDWGPVRNALFLPRVSAGRLILSRAQWQMTMHEWKLLTEAGNKERFLQVQKWRDELRLPRFVALADGDNELIIDLDNVLSVDTFVYLLKRRGPSLVVEMFPTPELLCAEGPKGCYVHEIVIPFVRTQGSPRATVGPRVSSLVQRSFPPGSEWLYVKLYTGVSTADQILRDVLSPLIKNAAREGLIDQWFFIRYGDPDLHLRVRFHGIPERLLKEFLPALQSAVSPLLDDRRIWRIQFDTYEREIKRYGGDEGILLAERIFNVDSECVLTIIEMFSGDEGTDARWRLTLRGMDMLLSALGFDAQTKHDVVKEARSTFGEEFKADTTSLKHQLGKKFKEERKSLETLLDSTNDQASPLAYGLEALRIRSQRLESLAVEFEQLRNRSDIPSFAESQAFNYLHMFANRMLRSANPAHELALYDFLLRLYKSRAARQRAKT